MSQPALARTISRATAWSGRPSRPSAAATLRLVPTVIGRQRNESFALLCVAILVAGLVGLLLLNTTLGQGAFTMADLRTQSTLLADRQEAMTQGLDQQRSTSALATRAYAMGMVPASSTAFIHLSTGKITGVAKPAKRDPSYRVVATSTGPIIPSAVPKPPATQIITLVKPPKTETPTDGDD